MNCNRLALPIDRQDHGGPYRPRNQLDDFVDVHPLNRGAIHLHDHVATVDSSQIGRAAIDRRQDDHFLVNHLQRNPHAAECSAKFLVKLRLMVRWNVNRIGIVQRPQHSFDGLLLQKGIVDGIDIVVGNFAVNLDDGADPGIFIIALPQRAGQLERQERQENDADEPRQPFSVHTIFPNSFLSFLIAIRRLYRAVELLGMRRAHDLILMF